MYNITLNAKAIRRLDLACLLLAFGLAGYFLTFLHIGWLSNGGTGSDLPYNLLAWCFTSLTCAAFWIVRPSTSKMVITPLLSLLLIGAVLMSLPLMWSPSSAAFYNALPRIGGLWAGMVFFLTIRQAPFTKNHKLLLLYSLTGAGAIEAIIVLVELYGPTDWLPVIWQKLIDKYGRGGVGVFQQVNVTSSFLAVSLASSLFLFAFKDKSTETVRFEKFRLLSLAVIAILVSSVLTLVYSRVGWLGGICSIAGIYIMLTFSQYKNESRYQIFILLLPAIGIIVGYNLMHFSVGQALAAHAGSNKQRILTLYHTVIYANKYPVLGYGAGTYEGGYQSFMAKLLDGNLSRELMSHPHNELLYQYAEGGVIALAGVLIWCCLYIRLWLRAKNVTQIAALLAMLPLILHTQVEYPLYYSVPHWVMLLILIRLADDEKKIKFEQSNKRHYALVGKFVLVLLSLYGAVISFQANENAKVLSKFESNELPTGASIAGLRVSWIQHLRYEEDKNLARLIDFQQTHDTESLLFFVKENERIISVHPCPELYSNQIAVLNYLHEYKKAKQWLMRARYTLPWMTEFQ
ncbi:Wzy polymerase domain-containing protein [Scandinavium sp. V105_16]|uniref:Wzy polymerase domain-containing protein n=1 Tax=Scandinavium lactucae TaxID=3095028 RepID=A0AAJ2S8R7_9ENTR|nr:MULTISPECIES: Wzy polymerase domain-containing protein [unclassified Scandinavium]MDX6020480.1 Wzy polymerase domain-containing protein [Scandinavium sp. V105_16]MDX6031968.1 Wzy polymerase domain-containing protein [Scandinavium sp. V105_12]MDX6039834.1 Wzy polymerase domain-containing protein [Scandinavium sp. V105_6]MDX6051433.1 Wzy polymerase domain-containing protein [Scandinavium sp. V105_1]